MNHSVKTNKGHILTITGLIAMVLMTLTKIVPSSQIAGYSVLVGIAFFFIVEAVEKTPPAESGLRFKTFFADIKKPWVIILVLLPVVSGIVTLIVGDLVFAGDFRAHIMGRTDSMLSFDKTPVLIFQVVVAALGEEIAWRGFFVGRTMKMYPFWLCAVVSSVLFAAGHIAVGNFGLVLFDVATIFIDSLIYAAIVRKTGNCLISTFSHILCNAAGLIACLAFI
ncbi:MAG: type II CAAX endopeptidase family protein [Clostridia bacterium]|nr:type II CAAX endopeptidase family protein [Clostridia bacterium]